jgi:hypothetical protein
MGLKTITVSGLLAVGIAVQGIALSLRARADRVYLYYMRAIQKERKKNRQDLLQKAGLLILGSVLTLLVQMILKQQK